jgi:SAM-dependent methyltransferase
MPHKSCPVCGCSTATSFLARQGVPVHQNLLCRTEEEALAIPRGDLEMVICHECGFVRNVAFDQSKLCYGPDYDNSQLYSPSFDLYVDELVDHLVHERNVQRCTILEVGCGKGHFLHRLVEDEKLHNVGYGFDPSYFGPPTLASGRLRFESRYYDATCNHVHPDVVICRHVIEHIADPVNLIKTLRDALKNTNRSRVFIETPTVEWIFRGGVFWDFFYEHCSLFSAASLSVACRAGGFVVDSVRHLFKGQYLWLEASLNGSCKAPDVEGLLELARSFAASQVEVVAQWKMRLEESAKIGRVAIWGAGAKGATFANLLDPKRQFVDCVVDMNLNKQGKFIPGTGHPIVSDRSVGDLGIGSIILMNPNYKNEVSSILRETQLPIELIEGV